MQTIAMWFATVLQARQAVLDLLTSGLPRQDISVVIGAPQGERANDKGDGGGPPDFVTALVGAGALTLPEVGQVVAAGPLADTLASAGASTAASSLHSALVRAGAPEDQAQTYADALRRGGALVAVRSDGAWDTIVQGVFRHSAHPSLREQEESAGPAPADELESGDAGAPVSASVGALTGGTTPGTWGAVSILSDTQDEA